MAFREKVNQKVEQIRKELAEPPGGSSTTADEVQRRAVAATLDGDWESYMRFFTDDPNELAKLKPEKNPNQDEEVFQRNLSRSYFIGNGNCGAASTGNDLLFEVNLVKLGLEGSGENPSNTTSGEAGTTASQNTTSDSTSTASRKD